LSCDDPNLYLFGSDCVIATACNPTHFAYDPSKTCEPCSSPCTQCTEIGNTACIACENGFNFYNNSCRENCPGTSISINGVCEECTDNCQTCDSVLNNCTSCKNGYFLEGNQCKIACENQGFYENAETNTCEACPDGCIECLIFDFSFCSSCNTSSLGTMYYLSKTGRGCTL
jgi:proprotein convertase subtilisin/kexin type 5